MKRTLWALLLACHWSLHAADDIAILKQECDVRGANIADPQRPADVPARYYHREGDAAFEARAIHACTQAWEHSQDVRYLYQRGLIHFQNVSQKAMRRFVTGEREPTGLAALAESAQQHNARSDLRRAADLGYHPALLALSMIDFNEPQTEQMLQDLMPIEPRLAHAGLAHWHTLQVTIDKPRADHHHQQAESHLRAAIAAGDNNVWLALANLYAMPGYQDVPRYISVLQEGIRHSAHPGLRSELALALHVSGLAQDAQSLHIENIPGVDQSDIETERLYLRGMQSLQGIQVAKDQAQAVKYLKLAAQSGHLRAKTVLMSMKTPWWDAP